MTPKKRKPRKVTAVNRTVKFDVFLVARKSKDSFQSVTFFPDILSAETLAEHYRNYGNAFERKFKVFVGTCTVTTPKKGGKP